MHAVDYIFRYRYMSGNEIQEISNSSLIGLSSLHTLLALSTNDCLSTDATLITGFSATIK